MDTRASCTRQPTTSSMLCMLGSALIVTSIVSFQVDQFAGADEFLTDYQNAARSCERTTLDAFQRIDDPMADGVTISCTEADTQANPGTTCWVCSASEGKYDREFVFRKSGDHLDVILRDCGNLKKGNCGMIDPDGDGTMEPGCEDALLVPGYKCSAVTDREDQTP